MELFGSDCQKTNQQINQQQQFWQQGCKETFRNTVQKQCGQRSFQPLQNLGKNTMMYYRSILEKFWICKLGWISKIKFWVVYGFKEIKKIKETK